MVSALRRALLLLPLTLWSPGFTEAKELPRSELSVWRDNKWEEWWRSTDAPTTYDERSAVLAPLVVWRSVAHGVDTGELQLSGSGEAWRLRLVLARIDPARVRFEAAPRHLSVARMWTIDSMSADALLAMNAGQFRARRPWGWLVIDGNELQRPELPPLAMAVVVDSAGRVSLVTRDEITVLRETHAPVRLAFQSYPTALVDGVVPPRLRDVGHGVNVGHRDGRLGLCTLRDGRVIVALTRFDALAGRIPELPFGTTQPEMVAVMGALGCVRAVMLDGGISRHFGVREHGELTFRHKGWRVVPMGLEVKPRPN